MSEYLDNPIDNQKENIDLWQEIILLRKELEKAQIEIASVKSLANEKISYLSWEIDTTKQLIFAILSGLNPEIQNQNLVLDFKEKMKDKVDWIIRV